MPTISMFYGIIIRMYFAPGLVSILHLIFMFITLNIRQGLIFARVRLLMVSCQISRPS